MHIHPQLILLLGWGPDFVQRCFTLLGDLFGLVYLRFEDPYGLCRFHFYLCDVEVQLGRRPKSVQL